MFGHMYTNDRNYRKVRDHCHYAGKYRSAAHIICNLKYIIPKTIPVVLHNVSNYGYHFIIKEVAEEFKGEFIFLGAPTEKYKVFSVLITIEVKRVFKNGKEPTKTIFYRRQFIDSARFMASSLSGLVNNLAEGVHKIKCKYEHNNKKIEPCGVRYKDCEWCLKYPSVKNYLIEYKYIYCSKICQKKFDENLKKRFANKYKFSNNDTNKIILFLLMNQWEKFGETLLPDKEDIYSHLNQEDISNADNKQAKRVCKVFEIKKKYANIMICMFRVIHYCKLMYLELLEYVSWKI